MFQLQVASKMVFHISPPNCSSELASAEPNSYSDISFYQGALMSKCVKWHLGHMSSIIRFYSLLMKKNYQFLSVHPICQLFIISLWIAGAQFH